ncbi:hypothetical protein cypCar_00019944 [Cyprinus carpio]|nr:hypothetical protein cypCar_00019944 [Cyprinus carpio]
MEADASKHWHDGFINTQVAAGWPKAERESRGREGVSLKSYCINKVSLSQRLLSSGFINYVQSVHKGVEPTVDFLTITVSDGIQRSAPLLFYIIINPTNDEIPSLLLSNFTFMEGGMKDLSPDILNAVDVDISADTITMTILVPPAHGTLLNGIYGLKMNCHSNKP